MWKIQTREVGAVQNYGTHQKPKQVSKNRCLHHEAEVHMRQAEGASEASTRAKRAAHDPKCIRLGVNTSEGPKCIQPGMYDCLEYNGTHEQAKRVDNGVLDTLKRDLWTNRLEGWRKNIHP